MIFYIIQGKEYFLDVEHRCRDSFGKLFVKEEKNNQIRKVLVCHSTDFDKFWDLMFKAIDQANLLSRL